MKILLCSLLFMFWRPSVIAQPTAVLQKFILDLAGKRLSNTALEEKYFCQMLFQQQSAASNKARTVMDNYLTLLRSQLTDKQVYTEEIKFVPFNLLSDKDFELIGDTQQVYAAQYRGSILCYFLMKEDRIDSFLLLNQGGRAYFVSFCE